MDEAGAVFFKSAASLLIFLFTRSFGTAPLLAAFLKALSALWKKSLAFEGSFDLMASVAARTLVWVALFTILLRFWRFIACLARFVD